MIGGAAALAALMLLIGATASAARTLTVEVREFRFTPDYIAARPDSVTVEVDRGATLELRRGPDGDYSGEVSALARRLVIRVRPRETLMPRTVELQLSAGDRNPKLKVRLHLVERVDVNYGYAAKAVPYLDSGQFDLFLALTEYALQKVQQEALIDQLRVRLEYYYATALMQACTSLAYDTCRQAVARLRSLIALYPGKERFFAPDNVSAESLKATLDSLLKRVGET